MVLKGGAGHTYDGCMGYSIRTDRYRYTEWIKNWRTFQPYDAQRVRGRELYDYKEDPEETRNLVDAPDYKEDLNKMQSHLHTFFEECRKKS